MTERITLFAHVLLPLPVPKQYTYRVPFEWNDELQIGQRVAVQFGPRKIYAGIVTDFSDQPPEKYQASYILDILDAEPLVSPLQLKFWEWIAAYYMCYQGDVMHAALPAGLRMQSESVIVLNPDFDEEVQVELDEKEWLILSYLIKHRQMTLDEAARQLEVKSPLKYIKSLYSRGFVLMQEEVKDSYKPKTETWLKLAAIWDDENFAREQLDQLEKRAPRQASVVLAMLGNAKKEFLKKDLTEKHGIESSHIKSLEKKGLIEMFTREISRLEVIHTESSEPELSADQKIAADAIQKAFDKGENSLLYGVTGSGKTHVYIHFIRQMINQGKQVLYLVPEVGLTEQLVLRLGAFFGDSMAVWHNYYSGAERTEIYGKVKSGEVKLLLGARSALFAPFTALGLIVIDEEHENTFKQFDKRPHYHARDAAIQLASMTDARVLLGSATPSYEMLFACSEGKMQQVNLLKRFIDTPKPEIRLVNTGEAKRQNRMKQLFSLDMLEGIQKTMDAGGQIIVFQNRKGYVPYISCSFCGYTAHCVNCDIALTYYKSLHTQKCNYCGYSQDPPSQCPACGSSAMTMKGFGTERITEDLAIFFPDARITRFDHESIRRRSDFQRIIQGFANKQIDILVGTQLLSKGLDFENVGLVCVPDADMLLNIPDFRSHERAFQQIYQVAGRAGRGSKQGVVLIQSHQPAHPVLQAVENDDFSGLAETEIQMRKALDYPPYTRLIRIVIRHKDRQTALNAATAYGNLIRGALHERLLGPQEPVVGKIRNYYLQHLLVKMDPKKDSFHKIKQYLNDASLVLLKTDGYKGVWVDFDVDPA